MSPLADASTETLLALRANMTRGIVAIALHEGRSGEAEAGAHLQMALLPAFEAELRRRGIEPEPWPGDGLTVDSEPASDPEEDETGR